MKLTDFEVAAVKKAASLMLNALHTQHTIDQLTGKVHLSRSKFIEAFKMVHGQSPGQFLLRHRIQSAMMLLKDSNISAKKVAATVGYDNVSAFVRAFKREVGISPMQYREHHSHND